MYGDEVVLLLHICCIKLLMFEVCYHLFIFLNGQDDSSYFPLSQLEIFTMPLELSLFFYHIILHSLANEILEDLSS